MVKASINHDIFSDRTTAPARTSDYSAESLRALKAGQLHKPPAPSTDNLSVNDVFSSEMKDIPDAAAIHAARKLREERRAAGIIGEKDTGFISLGDEKVRSSSCQLGDRITELAFYSRRKSKSMNPGL